MKNTLKTIQRLITFSLCCAGSAAADPQAGPKGGRMLDTEPHRAEFFVNDDRHVEVAFYDASMTPVNPGDQIVEVTVNLPTGRRSIAMQKTKQGFVSREPLPAGEPYRLVVQVRPAAGARPKNFRIDLNLEVCGGCSYAEYACTCEGH